MALKLLFKYERCQNLARKIICPPYDVLNIEQARKLAEGNPHSFLHVSKSEIDLPSDADPYDDSVYKQAGEALRRFIKEEFLIAQPASYYAYRLIDGDHSQTGIVGAASVKEYETRLIKRHELTREEKVLDRTRHALAIDGHSEPVFLVHRKNQKLSAIAHDATAQAPIYDIIDEDGVRHLLWSIKKTRMTMEAFEETSSIYIADGHHRSEAAFRVCKSKREANPSHAGDEPYNFFPAVIFPEDEVKIFQYDLNCGQKNRPPAKVTMKDIMDLSDRGEIMPPKQTWFSPKLASGLFVYRFYS
jgi:uncharacterized protein (DUF1015 family)